MSEVEKTVEQEEEGDNWLGASIWAFALVGILAYIWPSLIPFRFFEFWRTGGTFFEAVIGAWPIYLWAVGVTGYLAFTTRNSFLANRQAEAILTHGALTSVLAGVLEEICFRWLLFFSAIILIPIIDWIFLGCIWLHWVKWTYTLLLCPIANFFTFGYLEQYLLGGHGWAVGAAMISVNGRFRDGHAYLGLFGYVNSWFGGMYFFWIVLHHGIIAAMFIHFLYDFLIDLVIYLDMIIERKRGFA